MCSGAPPAYARAQMARRLRGTTIALAALLMLAATSALAASIVGTARNDVLRGTPAADRISGGRGNDRLFGHGGNDVLTGGPAVDRFDCGAGRDVANAQAGESVARNCEVVRRAPVSQPPPSPPSPPAPPPPPPPPTAQAGKLLRLHAARPRHLPCRRARMRRRSSSSSRRRSSTARTDRAGRGPSRFGAGAPRSSRISRSRTRTPTSGELLEHRDRHPDDVHDLRPIRHRGRCVRHRRDQQHRVHLRG